MGLISHQREILGFQNEGLEKGKDSGRRKERWQGDAHLKRDESCKII